MISLQPSYSLTSHAFCHFTAMLARTEAWALNCHYTRIETAK